MEQVDTTIGRRIKSIFENKTFRRFRKRKVSVMGGIILTLFVLLAIFGPMLTPYSPIEQDLSNSYQGISSKHWLGTDNLGRDTLTRIIYGCRISFLVSIVSVGTGLLAGLILGSISGYYGGRIDTVIMRFVDMLLAFQGFLLAIVIVAILGNGLVNTMIAVYIFTTPDFARIIRGSVMSIKETEFIEASRALGADDFRIIFRHILPNSLSPMIVQGTLM